YFGTIVIVPLWLQEYMGYNAESAGIAVAALGIGPLILSIFLPSLIKTIGNVLTLLIAMFILGAACFFNAFLTTDITIGYVAFTRFFFGIGLVFYINPLLRMSVQDIPTQELPHATGIFHFIRAMIGAVGTSLFTTFWERRTIF